MIDLMNLSPANHERLEAINLVYRDHPNATFVLNHSGGKDSQATAILVEFSDIPANQILVIHAVLPEVDWDGIQEHISNTIPSTWEDRYCQAGKTLLEMVERKFESRPDVPSFPSPANRQCTSDLKRDPIAKMIRAHSKETGQLEYVQLIGIRAEESSSRAKAKTWKRDNRNSKAGREIHEYLPIHDMLIDEVFELIADHGQKPHWAYAAGMTRLSCCFCIMASKADLQTAASLRPQLAQRYIELEERTGYTMSMSRQSLKSIIEESTL